ncbi:nitronate monooxygenase [Pelagicoccus sp. SDUM812003]|uniref:nitronate monooxygenase n=1 Tax=Pelagicoccus sp. SDUM812003 TaxID=3041267 RepID=UPI00280DDDEC|nr:nitronate monooxygenase [Pelagicoccus sp. SDUM812003]MDQ8204089.1 nitronate monooxygenase [Pelagicoccus sp. SDUM812003]
MTTFFSRNALPALIQGGMGIAISNWRLARSVARRGHLGVVSGTAIDRVVACRLQEGDQDGLVRQAFDAFPNREMADRVYARWHRPEGLPEAGAYRPVPMFSADPPAHLLELAVIASFTEVWLAKRSASGPVGINLLEKIQAPTLPLLYGALLAGVDYVLMGAGIPRDIPSHLDALSQHQPCSLKLKVEGGEDESIPFDPSQFACQDTPILRPKFLAIVSSHVLAMSLARSGGVDGFVVEGPTAGGHNAGPRGWSPAANDEPVYGPKDAVSLERIKALGLPFWLAGGQEEPDALQRARELGAAGIQVGTAFAFCSDSGMDPRVRLKALAATISGQIKTLTEGRGSPTGFPFKVLPLPGTEGGRAAAERIRQSCLHGYLRSAFRKADGTLGWRCPSEPEELYVAKGGKAEDCPDRRCLCNGLLATAGFPHKLKEGGTELALVTTGLMENLKRFLAHAEDYDANAVIDYFCGAEAKLPATV